MPEKKLSLKIISPEGLQYEGCADSVVLCATDGKIGIHKGHLPAIIALEEGDITIINGNDVNKIKSKEGFAKVENDVITVLLQRSEI